MPSEEETLERLRTQCIQLRNEHASLEAALKRAKKKISAIQGEKNTLLDKLLVIESKYGASEGSTSYSADELLKEKEHTYYILNTKHSDVDPPHAVAVLSKRFRRPSPRKRGSHSEEETERAPVRADSPDEDVPLMATLKREKTSEPSRAPPPPPPVSAARKRPLPADQLARSKRKCLAIPRDDYGEYMLPFDCGQVMLLSLGKIVPEDAWHSDRYIIPEGFCTSKWYFSTKTPGLQVRYVSHVSKDPETGNPRFTVTPDDRAPSRFLGTSSSACWRAIAEAAAKCRGVGLTTTLSGPEWFGLTNPTIMNAIQNLPGADKCEKYKRQPFEVVDDMPGIRTAKRKREGKSTNRPAESAPMRSASSTPKSSAAPATLAGPPPDLPLDEEDGASGSPDRPSRREEHL